jgi:hypothetical protein
MTGNSTLKSTLSWRFEWENHGKSENHPLGTLVCPGETHCRSVKYPIFFTGRPIANLTIKHGNETSMACSGMSQLAMFDHHPQRIPILPPCLMVKSQLQKKHEIPYEIPYEITINDSKTTNNWSNKNG